MNNLRLCVIDDFYPDPQVARQYALSLPFKEMESSAEKTFYKGRLTERRVGRWNFTTSRPQNRA
jgi:hypothetical protein